METTANTTNNRLANLPVPLFATVMGLAGFTLATQQASRMWGWHEGIGMTLTSISIIVYFMILFAFLAKTVKYPQIVKAEFNHPIRISFFPASSIGLILLGLALIPYHLPLSFAFWAVGALAQLIFTLVILSNWIHHDCYQIQHSNPAWFIPIVGNILVPIGAVVHNLPEVGWFFFSIGLMMWLPLLAVLLNRFFFHPMMPAKMLPTLFILIAPPAIGFISWFKLQGDQIDDVGRILYYFGLFITLLLVSQYRFFSKLKFALPWWAYSFPVAAITFATMLMATRMESQFFNLLSMLLYAALTLLILLLVVNTIRAMMRKEICIAEH